MARGKPVELSTRTFRTQTEATAFFREMLNRYRPGDRVADADAVHLAALLERHSEYTEKRGCGIDHFAVMKAPDHPTNCFEIVRKDGSRDDFSYPHCISPRH